MNGGGGDLGYGTIDIGTVATGVREKYSTVKDTIMEHFLSFVTSSNPNWYAVYAQTFFIQVAEYVDDLLDVDLAGTMDKFLSSLRDAAEAWKGMTGNEYDGFKTTVDRGTRASAVSLVNDDNYKTDLNGKAFMTENCEKNVGGLFEKFASDVKAAILTMAEPFGIGELIGGDQSEAFINMIAAIGTKFEQTMADQKVELERALHDSREKYEEQAAKVAAVKLEESGE